MTATLGKKTTLSLILVLAASSLFAMDINKLPPDNWAAPATWSPAKSRGVGTMDLTNPLPLVPLAPCRIVDTRGGAPITGGIFTGGSDVRSYAVSGICGIPSSARALSLNFTITGPGQIGPGFLLAWPTGGAVPPVSILNWDHFQAQIANAAVVPTNTSVSFTVNVSAPTHVIIDVNGYYYDGASAITLTTGENFRILASIASGGAIYGTNGDSSGYGVWGNNVGGIGIYGTSTFYNGVWGQSTLWDAVAAFGGRDGAYLQGARNGAIGATVGTTGALVGLAGVTASPSNNAAGVLGIGGTGGSAGAGVLGSSGVLGTAKTGDGVAGISQSRAVVGLLFDSAGGFLAEGDLATHAGGSSTYGLWTFGDTGIASGTKFFVEPHPTDASKVIRYAALEGPESGTYFRGSARTVRGQAVIEVPESFRMVTDEERLTVQVTPIGDLATMAVASKDLNHIVVRSSKDVTFDYLVHGVRRAFKNQQPIVEGGEFMPRSPEERMPAYLTEEDRSRLIANGTYNPDGTVNQATAERLGWTKLWADREAEARAFAQKAAAEREVDRQKR